MKRLRKDQTAKWEMSVAEKYNYIVINYRIEDAAEKIFHNYAEVAYGKNIDFIKNIEEDVGTGLSNFRFCLYIFSIISICAR